MIPVCSAEVTALSLLLADFCKFPFFKVSLFPNPVPPLAVFFLELKFMVLFKTSFPVSKEGGAFIYKIE